MFVDLMDRFIRSKKCITFQDETDKDLKCIKFEGAERKIYKFILDLNPPKSFDRKDGFDLVFTTENKHRLEVLSCGVWSLSNCWFEKENGSQYSFASHDTHELLMLENLEFIKFPKTAALPLLEHFLAAPTTAKTNDIPLRMHTWAYPIVAGTAAASLYFIYKTYRSIREILKSSSNPAFLSKEEVEEKERSDREMKKRRPSMGHHQLFQLFSLSQHTA